MDCIIFCVGVTCLNKEANISMCCLTERNKEVGLQFEARCQKPFDVGILKENLVLLFLD